MSSPLEALIAQFCANGTPHSTGCFSLDRQTALDTMAQLRLPYANAWVLKIAQAAMLAGATFLDVWQTASETRFEFNPISTTGSYEFQKHFFDPAHKLQAWLEALRLGLWSVGVAKRRPFDLQLPHQSTGLFWNGGDLLPTHCEGQPTLQLRVSHRAFENSKGVPILRSIEAAWINSAIREVISTALYTLPLKLKLNGCRGDGFHFCPGHGFGEQDHPLKLLTVEIPDLPNLLIPPGCRENLRGLALPHPKLSKLSQHFQASPDVPTQAVALLSAHCHYEYGRSGGWRIENRKSILCWVRHGVVVQREDFQLEPGSVSMAVFVNADHIPTDFSGFQLQEASAAPLRQMVCRALTPVLLKQRLETRLVDRRRHKKLLRATGGLAIGALLLSTLVPGAAVVSAGSAVAAFVLAGGLGYVDSNLEDHFNRLLDAWKSKYPFQ